MPISSFLVQIASVPGNQIGQRQFEQCRFLHDLLVNALIDRRHENDREEQINALSKLVPRHKIVLRSGFSQTSQWGLEPNMFIEVYDNAQHARAISALFGKAFCQDAVGIIGDDIGGHTHNVLIVTKDWKDDEERFNFVSAILRQYPSLSAQLDCNGQLTFHDYSMLICSPSSTSSSSSPYLFDEIIRSIHMNNNSEEYFIEKRTIKSELIDQAEYENLLMVLESSNMHHICNMLRQAHVRLFSGYACASLSLPSISISRRQKRRQHRQDKYDKSNTHSVLPPHFCSLIFISRQPCMCLTDGSCFCHYTLTFTTYISASRV